jgi:hypothetical protein
VLVQVINALNSIRCNALVGLCAAAAEEMQEVMLECCAILINVPTTRKLSAAEQATHLEACEAMLQTACPLVVQLFQHVCSLFL